jgi:hypothetical protein|tara:strand:+ start:2160 stop:2372 length:213 start_codon:yes stop_codon:yes gene_type:complete
MSYQVYLDKKIAFENLTKLEAEQKKKEFEQLIDAGIKSVYSKEDIKIVHIPDLKDNIWRHSDTFNNDDIF